jgi:LPS sulfotransferase NodH
MNLMIFWSNYPEKKFLIFAEGRGGSSLLVDLLNSHPDIYCDGEIFNAESNGKIWFPRLYLESRTRVTRLAKKSVYGFKVKYTQLVLHQEFKKDFIKTLHNSGWKIIYLKRNNYLKATISTILAEKRGFYHQKGIKLNNLEKIKINVEELYQKAKGRERSAKLEEDWLIGTDYHFVIYENDLLNPDMHQRTANKIFQFLEIPNSEISTNFKKVSTGDLSLDIENFDEVKDYLGSSEYAHLLNSD